MIRLLYGCCKTGKQVNGVFLQRKEHASQLSCSPYKGAELCSASRVFPGDNMASSNVFSLWAVWVLGRTSPGVGSW